MDCAQCLATADVIEATLEAMLNAGSRSVICNRDIWRALQTTRKSNWQNDQPTCATCHGRANRHLAHDGTVPSCR
jgi:hypothetical protein